MYFDVHPWYSLLGVRSIPEHGEQHSMAPWCDGSMDPRFTAAQCRRTATQRDSSTKMPKEWCSFWCHLSLWSTERTVSKLWPRIYAKGKGLLSCHFVTVASRGSCSASLSQGFKGRVAPGIPWRCCHGCFGPRGELRWHVTPDWHVIILAMPEW